MSLVIILAGMINCWLHRFFACRLTNAHVAVVAIPPPPSPPICNHTRFSRGNMLRWQRTNLATMSISILCERAQTIELRKYNATAVKRIGFRPQMSESLTQIGAAVAFARRYAPPIHEYPEAEWRSDEIVGIAVAMIVWFRDARKSVD